MEDLKKICVDALLKSGVEKAEVHVNNSEKNELNVVSGKINLLRTIYDTNINLCGIKDGRKGSIVINKKDIDSINNAVCKVKELIAAAEKDDANDIADEVKNKEFTIGNNKPDLDKMYKYLNEFMKTVKEKYPKIFILEAILDFTHTESDYYNSNGVDYKIFKGIYNFEVEFTAKDKEKATSFNYTFYSFLDLKDELISCGNIESLFKESIEQLDTKNLSGKFQGDVIITPDCLNYMIYSYADAFLSDFSLITGSSILKDKLNSKVASPKLTLYSKPVSSEISNGYFVTPDGYEAKNSCIIDRGVLKSFLLSSYGAKKTKKERSLNVGDAYVIEPGDKSLKDIIKNTKKGILLCRFSGGNPASNGDFSGVAKNSFYIENGEIKYAVSEIMLSANLYKMFNDINDISKDRVNFGSSLMPYISIGNVTISGK